MQKKTAVEMFVLFTGSYVEIEGVISACDDDKEKLLLEVVKHAISELMAFYMQEAMKS